MVLVPAQEQVVSEENDVLRQLMALITSGSIRRTHKYRLERGKIKPVWFATPRGRRSFKSVLELIRICTTERITALLEARWVTVDQLETFVRSTRLSDCHQALFERAIRIERARVAELERSRLEREQGAAKYTTNTGMTGELQRIAGGERGHELRSIVGGPARFRRGEQVRTPA